MEYLGAQIFPRVDQPRLIKMLCYLDLVDLLNLSGGRLWQIRCEGVLHNAPPFKQLLRSCVSNLGKKGKKFFRIFAILNFCSQIGRVHL